MVHILYEINLIEETHLCRRCEGEGKQKEEKDKEKEVTMLQGHVDFVDSVDNVDHGMLPVLA